MDKKEKFKNYMYSGHGRAFRLLRNNKDDFRDIVLYGCMNDISFDMQCEGSRGCYMYNLAWEYSDSEFFLKHALKKFLTDDVNDDWHTICHLCDFIRLFAENDKNKNALDALFKKYNDLYSIIMLSWYSEKTKDIIQSFEYVSITLMQISNFKFALKIFGDMGACFIRRRRTPNEDLKWLFQWFYCETKEKFGEDFVTKQLEEHIKNSKEIRCFYIIMKTPEKKYQQTEKLEPTAENVIKQIEADSFKPGNSVYFRRNAEQSEKVKLADMITSENDMDKKIKMLNVFTHNGCPFPLAPNVLIEYTRSENESLRDMAIKALSCIRADCVHDFASEIIDKNDSDDILNMLIYNCRDDDREFIFNRLNDLANKDYCSDFDSVCDLHGVIFTILDIAENIESELVNELLMFAYEKSPCSCCRNNVVEELEKRNLMTEEILKECIFDANSDIREKAEKMNNFK